MRRQRSPRPIRPTQFAPYGNCTVLPPDSDEVMFRCNEDRRQWYLGNKLAVVVTEDPPVIRLTFSPKGPGHAGDPYFLQEFKNRCVVCGRAELLSHHHIVPDCYRKYFPRTSQELGRWMYDVLLLDVDCHSRYELRAHELKETISKEYGIPSSGISNLSPELVRVVKAAAALYRHEDKIPEPKRQAFLATVKGYLKKDDLVREDFLVWKRISRSAEVTPAGKLIAEKIADIDDFAIRWRHHFLKTMKPQFLPEGWNPDRRIYSEPDQVTF